MGLVENHAVRNVVAIDLGASSGRVMRVRFVPGAPIEVAEAHRFANGPRHIGESLRWDVHEIFDHIVAGIGAAACLCAEDGEKVDSIGIDSWAVDYGLFDESGELVSLPHHYRDSRTEGLPQRVYSVVSAQDHYAINGMQTQPFNTEFQLVAEAESGGLVRGQRLLLIPDLLGYWLTGRATTEVTNASTTGLVDARTRTWSTSLISRLEREVLDDAKIGSLLTELVEAGTTVGFLLPEIAQRAQIDNEVLVIAVGSHDTASAVVAVPAHTDSNFAYISCGTWSLVGLELPEPILTRESRAANFANELGVDGTVRYLKNVMGLWVLQECVRAWKDAGQLSDVAELVELARGVEPLRTVIDINAPAFFPPGDMVGRIAVAAAAEGQMIPQTQGEIVRCIIDSLAHAYRAAIDEAEVLSGRSVEVVHMVGGGIQNELLCQMTADATGRTVIAGPVEGAIVGNALVQYRALEAQNGGPKTLRDLRAIERVGLPLKVYEPQ